MEESSVTDDCQALLGLLKQPLSEALRPQSYRHISLVLVPPDLRYNGKVNLQ